MVLDTLLGAVATKLVDPADQVVSVYHRRLEHGYPTPSVGRDAVLKEALPWLRDAGIWSRGRFGSYKYEVANQDHSMMLGVEAVDNVLFGTQASGVAGCAVSVGWGWGFGFGGRPALGSALCRGAERPRGADQNVALRSHRRPRLLTRAALLPPAGAHPGVPQRGQPAQEHGDALHRGRGDARAAGQGRGAEHQLKGAGRARLAGRRATRAAPRAERLPPPPQDGAS